MRKRIIPLERTTAIVEQEWLDLEKLAEVEVTSEDAAYPIESALLSDQGPGWRAAQPGKQTIRLLFAFPQRLERIYLKFEEKGSPRTQEYVLRWSLDGGHDFQEIVRQQWNFDPKNAAIQIEDYRVELRAVSTLELRIIPDISGGDALASLAQLRLC